MKICNLRSILKILHMIEFLHGCCFCQISSVGIEGAGGVSLKGVRFGGVSLKEVRFGGVSGGVSLREECRGLSGEQLLLHRCFGLLSCSPPS